MDFIEITGKTVEDAITNALIKLETTSDRIEYEVIEKGSTGFLGFIGKQDAVIKVRKKNSLLDDTYEFLDKLFNAMNLEVTSTIDYDEDSRVMNIDFSGDEMGILIGKRGQTLDSLQYLTSLVVNKEQKDYVRVKLDTENYRKRRKETLENLARNIAYKVKKTRRPVSLEPMNPYERRIIHSALQGNKFVETYSEGSEPYRHVVVAPKR